MPPFYAACLCVPCAVQDAGLARGAQTPDRWGRRRSTACRKLNTVTFRCPPFVLTFRVTTLSDTSSLESEISTTSLSYFEKKKIYRRPLCLAEFSPLRIVLLWKLSNLRSGVLLPFVFLNVIFVFFVGSFISFCLSVFLFFFQCHIMLSVLFFLNSQFKVL